MSQSRFPALPSSILLWLPGAAWVAYGIANGYRPSNLVLFAMATVVVTLGELLEVDLPGGRSTPVSSAVVFALFVLMPPIEVTAVAILAFAVGLIVRTRDADRVALLRSTSRRLAAILLSLAFYVWLAAVLPPFGNIDKGDLLARTLAMVIAGSLKLLADTGASALFISHAQRIPAFPIWMGQLSNRLAIHGAFLSVAALMALAYEVLGASAFVLFLLPLLAARRAFRRYASIHTTYVQTIRALSKVPEMAGYAPDGHSVRVAETAVAIARNRGLSDNQVQDIEFAALLHDVGRLSFEDPEEAPESAVGTRTGRRLALSSARIVGRTRYLERVAQIVQFQDEPFAEAERTTEDLIPKETQILKVANDFVELTEEGGPGLSRELAMHQLEQLNGIDYDPDILNALRKALKHRPFL